MADLIVLGGCAAVEAAAAAAGQTVQVPFTGGRGDATDAETDAASFAVLEPIADGFRNYVGPKAAELGMSPEALLIDKAHMLNLTPAEMTVLVGGMRALGATSGSSSVGVLTSNPGALTNDFFVNLLSMDNKWEPADASEQVFEAKNRTTGAVAWQASRVDLVFGSNSELRALAEFYASDDALPIFAAAFAKAWGKVMQLDRFDLA